MLKTALVSNDSVLDQSAIIVVDLHLSVEGLVLNQLDYFVENFLHREVVCVLIDFTLLKQSEIEQVFHLELDKPG